MRRYMLDVGVIVLLIFSYVSIYVGYRLLGGAQVSGWVHAVVGVFIGMAVAKHRNEVG